MIEELILILCVSGLTGSGKTAVSEGVSKLGGIQTVLKLTTRPKRASDLDGEYCFVNSDIYNKMFQEKKFALHTKYYDHAYAIPYSILEEGKKKNISRFITPWAFGKDSVFDPRIRYVKIWLELSQEERVKRMLNRGDSKEYVAKRL
ncbi:AAA family ATPase, partial [Holospora undulata]